LILRTSQEHVENYLLERGTFGCPTNRLSGFHCS